MKDGYALFPNQRRRFCCGLAVGFGAMFYASAVVAFAQETVGSGGVKAQSSTRNLGGSYPSTSPELLTLILQIVDIPFGKITPKEIENIFGVPLVARITVPESAIVFEARSFKKWFSNMEFISSDNFASFSLDLRLEYNKQTNKNFFCISNEIIRQKMIARGWRVEKPDYVSPLDVNSIYVDVTQRYSSFQAPSGQMLSLSVRYLNTVGQTLPACVSEISFIRKPIPIILRPGK